MKYDDIKKLIKIRITKIENLYQSRLDQVETIKSWLKALKKRLPDLYRDVIQVFYIEFFKEKIRNDDQDILSECQIFSGVIPLEEWTKENIYSFYFAPLKEMPESYENYLFLLIEKYNIFDSELFKNKLTEIKTKIARFNLRSLATKHNTLEINEIFFPIYSFTPNQFLPFIKVFYKLVSNIGLIDISYDDWYSSLKQLPSTYPDFENYVRDITNLFAKGITGENERLPIDDLFFILQKYKYLFIGKYSQMKNIYLNDGIYYLYSLIQLEDKKGLDMLKKILFICQIDSNNEDILDGIKTINNFDFDMQLLVYFSDLNKLVSLLKNYFEVINKMDINSDYENDFLEKIESASARQMLNALGITDFGDDSFSK